jgi:hypothetical protein
MKTDYGTLEMTPPPIGERKRNVWARPVTLLAVGIACTVILSLVLP